ncbi:MAG TPA: DUF2207 domain-containing protein [Actinomycetales bacterium]|nr:DUF2207 domain-containing protein [Actinomycetales bacterium]
MRTPCLGSMSHVRRAVLALLVAAAALLVGAPTATADPGESIPSYQARVDVRSDGSIHVRETIRYTFAGSEHHGIYRDLRTQFSYDPAATGSDKVRVYPVEDVKVSSPDAPDDAEVSDEGSITHIRIGSPDKTVSGTKTYVLDYTVRGAFNSISQPTTAPDGRTLAPHDELYWNITGDQWEVPIASASVTVTASADPLAVQCFRGVRGSTDTCPAKAGATSTFSATHLQPGQGMSILLAYPTGTVTDASPIIQDAPKTGLAQLTDIHPAFAGAGVALFALLAGGMAWLVHKRGRDSQFVGLTPGLLPVHGNPGEVAPVTRHDRNVAVQFTPPEGLHPGQIGTLIDEQANTVDVTATIIDLAVRGYLRIEEVPPSKPNKPVKDWRLVVVLPAPDTPLEPYELSLMQAIFKGRNEVTMSALKNTFASDLHATQLRLYDDVTRRGWFRGNPNSVRNLYRFGGIALCALGFFAAFLGIPAIGGSAAIIALALFLGGLVVVLLAGRMPARTATGSAVLAQAEGFRLYLTTAEADQIKFEEGQDVFSRYLPYAIIFGVAERWAGIFDQLAREGRIHPVQPTWYTGYSPSWTFLALGNSMSGFETTANSALVSTPASSGGSGFSSGGGFSGGGGGGGGGGSW